MVAFLSLRLSLHNDLCYCAVVCVAIRSECRKTIKNPYEEIENVLNITFMRAAKPNMIYIHWLLCIGKSLVYLKYETLKRFENVLVWSNIKWVWVSFFCMQLVSAFRKQKSELSEMRKATNVANRQRENSCMG